MNLATVLMMMSVLTKAAGISKSPESIHDARAIAELIAERAADVHEAAMLVELAWEESAFTANAVSKDGHDLCAYQLRDAPRSVLTDLGWCTDLAIERLRVSVQNCPNAPLAIFSRGSCNSSRGRWFSEWRMRKVRRIEVVIAKEIAP
jgi:hypothetical protein